jgi:photosystem II stability/assembly factor-like uncharacterized protein
MPLQKHFFSFLFLLGLILVSVFANAQPLIEYFQPGPQTNLRGISAPSENICWLSGSHGWVGRTTNRGKHTEWQQVKGFEKCDFRSLYAFDSLHAVIANAGSPAFILETTDGGKNWSHSYENTDTLAFIDALTFRDEKNGMAIGDPVRGHFLLLLTSDGGKTWKTETGPAAKPGEACFAASGTCLQVDKAGNAWIGTGGSQARVFYSADFGKSWKALVTPVIHGKASQGVFSIYFSDPMNGIICGGDYSKDTLAEKSCFMTTDGGQHWSAPQKVLHSYHSCVVDIGKMEFIACGTQGTDWSKDDGLNWSAIDQNKLNSIALSREGKRKVVFLAGEKGMFGVLKQ